MEHRTVETIMGKDELTFQALASIKQQLRYRMRDYMYYKKRT